MDISKLSLTELKALAYDMLSTIDQAQRNLTSINQEIAKRQSTTEVLPPQQ
jgi:hypothetical protein